MDPLVKNPLVDDEPEALNEPTLTDTGHYISAIAIKTPEGTRSFSGFFKDDRTEQEAARWKSQSNLSLILYNNDPARESTKKADENITEAMARTQGAMNYILKKNNIKNEAPLSISTESLMDRAEMADLFVPVLKDIVSKRE